MPNHVKSYQTFVNLQGPISGYVKWQTRAVATSIPSDADWCKFVATRKQAEAASIVQKMEISSEDLECAIATVIEDKASAKARGDHQDVQACEMVANLLKSLSMI